MIVLEKWKPNKPISAVYFDGERSRYYVKRFMIEHPDKEEIFISEHPDSKLQIVALDYRPRAEIIFSKRSLENMIINLEEYIAIKGIKALGNQLTNEKIKAVDLLEPLPYIEPEINDVELVEEQIIKAPDQERSDKDDLDETDPDKGQITLF